MSRGINSPNPARGCPRPVAGRSQMPSRHLLSACPLRFAIPGFACSHSPAHGAWAAPCLRLASRKCGHRGPRLLGSLRLLVLTRPSGPGAFSAVGQAFRPDLHDVTRIRQVSWPALLGAAGEASGSPYPESRRMTPSAGRMPKRRRHPSEPRPGRPRRTSGDGVRRARSRVGRVDVIPPPVTPPGRGGCLRRRVLRGVWR